MKRIVTLQDISCLGRCSVTVALPVISAMGVECVALPTAVLSTHTMFPDFTCLDLTDQIAPIARHWKAQGIHFTAPGAGQADILLVPTYEVGNGIGKAMSLFGGAKNAGIILGAKVPVVLVSRADSAESKLASIALGAVTAGKV